MLLLVGAVVAAACAGTPAPEPPTGPGTTAQLILTDPGTVPAAALPKLSLQLITDALDEPVALATRPGDDRLFVAEKGGTVRALRNDTIEGVVLDLRDRVLSENLEQGLLGLAFDGTGSRLFVIYTDHSQDVRIDRFQVRDGAIDPTSSAPVLTVEQPHYYHQGGALTFGPDGYLWVGLGDGGDIGDPRGNAQNPMNLLGTVTRIDVDAYDPYAVPPDNPFVASGEGSPEVWAYGLRNPWRITFDAGFAYIADVGQYDWEEVNILPIDAGGANLGWSILEGDACYEAESCDTDGLVAPTLTIKHQRLCAVVGGPVYRGTALPELTGHYFYGDFCVGWVRSLVYDGASVVAQYDWEPDLGRAGHLTTFGVDGDGEILIANQEGSLFRIVPATSP